MTSVTVRTDALRAGPLRHLVTLGGRGQFARQAAIFARGDVKALALLAQRLDLRSPGTKLVLAGLRPKERIGLRPHALQRLANIGEP